MATFDQNRITRDRSKPRLMELWWALCPLKSVLRFMQTGAHPDDEISGMLAALAFRHGFSMSYACSTRGEGGQNDIGTENGADLGALRTREMEAACDILGMRLYWHGTHPGDTITDFGFSKSGKETLGKWGYDRTLDRFTEIVRTERPDVICPTFLDVPGQHGHHRAMTEAAAAVIDAAADQSLGCPLPPWQVKKLYLPAWSGAGRSYDDDLPPPPTTLVLQGTDREPASGWGWDRIGQQSRAFHRSQGMGRWVAAAQARDWPLHLAKSTVAGPDTSVEAGVPCTLQDLAALPGAEPIAELLRAAHGACARAIGAFPSFSDVADAACDALGQIMAADRACPASLRPDVEHRLHDKRIQLEHVIRLALGVDAHALAERSFLAPGEEVSVASELNPGDAEDVDLIFDLPPDWTETETGFAVGAASPLSDPYRAAYDPRCPAKPRLRVRIEHGGVVAQPSLAFEPEPVVLPKVRASVLPKTHVINLARPLAPFRVAFSDVWPLGASASLSAPDGWAVTGTTGGAEVTPPADLAAGAHRLTVCVGGDSALSVRRIQHDHIAPTLRTAPAEVQVAAVDVAVPGARVGYIGAGNDRVAHWMRAVGLDVEDLSAADLSKEDAFGGIDSLVIGIFAMRFRPGLREAMPALHRWVHAGGNLVTLYHRPWDNWDPDAVPPKRLQIGEPSLRWRVTDEKAEVRHLVDHPLLTGPNLIGPADWTGWIKERGLYFAKDWDAAYVPLLEMADPDEAPHRGALLTADIGDGRHVHCALILHYQMDHLVPGAFRLMANLVTPRR